MGHFAVVEDSGGGVLELSFSLPIHVQPILVINAHD